MVTPFNLLEEVVGELTGKPTFLFGYKPSDDGFRVMATTEVMEVSPYVLARFQEVEQITGATLPSFFKRVAHWYHNDHQGTVEVLREWMIGQRLHKLHMDTSIVVHEPTPSAVYSHFWNREVSRGVALFDVYRAPVEEFRGFLNEQEKNGNIRYDLWTPVLSYSLRPRFEHPESQFSGHGISGDSTEIARQMEEMENVRKIVSRHEKGIVDFMCSVNSSTVNSSKEN